MEITTETVSTNSRMRQYISEGAGSGVIVSKDGYIVTNNHVIDGASKITVKTTDKKSYTAKLIGKDVKTDLAVLKIEDSDLTTAVYGDSSKLVVGELAVAIGNPLGELGGTVTEGIISALNRDVVIDGQTMNLLQTSAAINPGNSGGGLFNEYGELIGIVNAKSSGSGIEGLGFAIRINTVIDIVDSIIDYGYVQGRIDTGLNLIDILDSQTARRYRVQSTGVYILKQAKA
ncbi:S1C family serine protease [Clostridium thermarum]|uniref:S1C family serine protease n=1 Tax=Clostridium thermarum TaxID=1716543 RepID=UPI001FACCE3E|nr:trypsin-like peptidase domain-containing protein [Clostridium thermarum]